MPREQSQPKAPPPRAREMLDLPPQAQARAYFKCGFHHGALVDMDNGDPAMKGCVVCNAQVTQGELYVREKENNKKYWEGTGSLNF